jgi:purine nucleoside permease
VGRTGRARVALALTREDESARGHRFADWLTVFAAALANAPVVKRIVLIAVLLLASLSAIASAAPIPIRVVVVTTFEPGADEGDRPGEFQYWVERLPLPKTIPFPQAYRHLRYNPATGILGIVTGEGAERGAASIMALGMDPRFDLSHAYWVVAGIAGIDPNVASVGSAAWANWVVNADLAFEVDARDMPATWSTGIVPLTRTTPFASPAPERDGIHGQFAYQLDPGLVRWAYERTRAVPLADTPNLANVRAPYAAFPAAMLPPSVIIGDSLCGDRYFVGTKMNDWAEGWVSYWTGGSGRFAMTAEEDAGILQSLTFLAAANRVDRRRVLVLRTASDYDEPGAGMTAAGMVVSDNGLSAGGMPAESAYREALEAAYRVGSPVVSELARNWSTDRTTIPASP